jgi:murein DD-endopeptidase MepM/ murein hydrolase activator NlpD
VFPSALRTLSVVTLLSAVSGSVILTRPSLADGATGTEEASTASAFRANPSTITRSDLDRASRSGGRSYLENAMARSDRDEIQALRAERPDSIAAQIAAARAERIRLKKVAEQKAAERRERRERQARQEAEDRARRSARSNPQAMARVLLAGRGWTGQFGCLNSLWNRESKWNYQAANPSSGAYGIPQALPGSKMSSAGSDWRTNPVTQMKWGLGYIADRYGTPCGAWAHSQSSGWY